MPDTDTKAKVPYRVRPDDLFVFCLRFVDYKLRMVLGFVLISVVICGDWGIRHHRAAYGGYHEFKRLLRRTCSVA